MNYAVVSLLFPGGILLGMVLLLEIGRRMGRRRTGKEEEAARAGLGAVEGAVFALLGLLIAFTFSGAAARFDLRRQLIVQEANALGTAWLRIDLLPSHARPALRDLFRRYTDARLALYQNLQDAEAANAARSEGNRLQGEIWRAAVAACQESPDPLKAQIIPALNELFDIATTRLMARQTHPPQIVFVMLGFLALMSALLAGYAMARARSRSWIHIIGFSVIMAATVYVILDLESPRIGLLRVDDFDRVLQEVRQSMN